MYKKEFIAMDKLEGRTGGGEEDNSKWVLCALLGHPCPTLPSAGAPWSGSATPVRLCGGLRIPLRRGWPALANSAL